MKILWLVAYSPWPPTGGGKIRVQNLIDQMLRRGHQVELWCVTGQPAGDAIPPSGGLTVKWFNARPTNSAGERAMAFASQLPVGTWKIRTHEVLEAIRQGLASDFDVTVLEQEDLGGLLPELIRTGVPLVLDAQNIESRLSWQIASAAPASPNSRLRRASDAVKYRFLENRLLRSVRATITMSDADKVRLAAIGARCPVIVHPNGVDLDYFKWSDHKRSVSDRLLLTGLLDFAPNFDASIWLSREIMPTARKRIPGASLMVVGAMSDKIAPRVRALHNPERGFHVVGQVPDVRPYLTAADLFVIPLRAGSGTRLKALGALASGLPIIGTPVGIEGLGLADERLALVASNAPEFAEAIVVGLRDERLRADLSERGRAYVEDHFDWRQIGYGFEQTLLAVSQASLGVQPLAI